MAEPTLETLGRLELLKEELRLTKKELEEEREIHKKNLRYHDELETWVNNEIASALLGYNATGRLLPDYSGLEGCASMEDLTRDLRALAEVCKRRGIVLRYPFPDEPTRTVPFWRFIHNAVSHPLLELLPQRWGDRFHDWTAGKAFIKKHGKGDVDADPR